MENGVLRPMTADEVAARAAQVVELPPFDDGTPFVAKVRRASLLAMLVAGRVPNHLLEIAWRAVKGELQIREKLGDNPHEVREFLELFCAATLVEPAWQDVRLYLTDEQILALVSYAQQGVQALESFRGRQEPDATDSERSSNVAGTAIQPDP